MTRRTVEQCLAPGKQKRILACDGGGILGLISVEILVELESQLRRATGQPNLVLGDWFDLVCGTSTGAIVASCIAVGMSMDQIRSFYVESGKDMFTRAGLLERLRYSYQDEPLARKLRAELDNALAELGPEPSAPALAGTLGDTRLRCLLMMVMRNHSTDSPWPLSNNPKAKYNQYARTDCNLKLPLWQLVRASTAAPTYFPPEVIKLGEGTAAEKTFVFVDGGLTTYNNPAFLAFQMATAAPYHMDWPTGVDQMLIVSVGTGSAAQARPDLNPSSLWLLDWAKSVPSALMNAASAGWDMACRTLGDCRFGGQIDKEVLTMSTPEVPIPTSTVPKLFSYVRYDPDVSAAGLTGLGLTNIQAEYVQALDSVYHIEDIQTVGRAYAKNVSLTHLKGFVGTQPC